MQVGGNVRLMLCGSAPTRGHVMTFLRATLGCVIVEVELHSTVQYSTVQYSTVQCDSTVVQLLARCSLVDSSWCRVTG